MLSSETFKAKESWVSFRVNRQFESFKPHDRLYKLHICRSAYRVALGHLIVSNLILSRIDA